jgi:hypothetical protein
MFAAGKSVSAGALKTTIFTSNTTWVAPAVTNNIVTLVGQGGDGVAGYWQTFNSLGAAVSSATDCGNPVYGASLDYSVSYGDAQSIQTTASGWTTSPSGQSVSLTRTYVYYWCPSTSNWRVSAISFSGTVRRIGTVALSGSMPSSGTAPTPPATIQEAFCTNIEFFNSPTTGAPTTAFGYSFPGGTGGAATPVTYNNVPVTPGASYSIVVPAGGSVSITYIG